MDDDVIGSAPERPRRPRGPARRLRLPSAARRHGRVVAVVCALAAVAGVVAISRAGVDGLQAAGPPPPPPLTGEVLTLAAGRNAMYAVATDCAHGCRPTLLGSDSDGYRWTDLPLPSRLAGAPAARSWTLGVSGVEDLLAIEDPAAGTVTVGNLNTEFRTRKIEPGPPLPRVPADRETMTRICPPPRCRTPILEFLEPRTGVRSPLETQPPFPPLALGVGGTQLWATGIDPRTRHYAVALSRDDGATWSTVPLPGVSTDPALVPRLAPVPELDRTWFLQGYPDGEDEQTSYDIWLVPAPVAPPAVSEPLRQVIPDPDINGASRVVGLRDGRLAIDGRTVLAPDGSQKRTTVPDVESARYLRRWPIRGPHQLLVAAVVRTDGVASIAVSRSGDPEDWAVRPVVLAR